MGALMVGLMLVGFLAATAWIIYTDDKKELDLILQFPPVVEHRGKERYLRIFDRQKDRIGYVSVTGYTIEHPSNYFSSVPVPIVSELSDPEIIYLYLQKTEPKYLNRLVRAGLTGPEVMNWHRGVKFKGGKSKLDYEKLEALVAMNGTPEEYFEAYKRVFMV